MTLFALPAEAFAAGTDVDSRTSCASVGTAGTASDIVSCLPSGRWGGSLGSLHYRNEPYSGANIAGWASNITGTMLHMAGQILPTMMLLLTQVCWSSALSLSQFAASFDPLQTAGAKVDAATANLIDNVMAGGIPATIAVIAIVAWIGAAGFQIGTVKEASKRIVIMILCFSALFILGSGAAKTGKDATAPAKGSPWWVVQTVNNTINKLSVSLNLDGIDEDSNMMAVRHGKGAKTNCQDYLYYMHDDYTTLSKDNGNDNASNITLAINRIWEETALRSWVTMQFGNPQITGTSSTRIAENARQAYCHILEMDANTNTAVQKNLTNKAMSLHLDDKKAKWLFSRDGWIDPQDSHFTDKATERDSYVYTSRAGVFWETCGVKRDTTDGIYARAGWATLINNMGDPGTKDIKNGSTKVRVKVDDLSNVKPTSGGEKVMSATANADENTTISQTKSVCKAVLGKDTKFLARDTDINKDDSGQNKTEQNNTNWGDAATLGWRFDIPNVSGTWAEANLRDAQDDSTVTGGAKKTIDYMYGNNNVDTLAAFGSVLASVINLVVWGLLSMVLIVTKLMLVMMCLFLAAAFLVTAFPIGEKPKKALKNWATYTCQLSMVGGLYGVLGSIATFICGLMMKFTVPTCGSFAYQLVAGTSPLLAIMSIGLFCSKVLKCGNPFSLRAMMGMATGTGMASGLQRGLQGLRHHQMMNALGGGFRHGRGVSRLSTNGTGSGMGRAGARKSSTILESMSEAQQSELDQKSKNLLSRDKDEYTSIMQGGRRSRKWAEMGQDTVRGSLAGAERKMELAHDKMNKRLGTNLARFKGVDNTERYFQHISARHPGMDLGKARKRAERWNTVANAGRAMRGALGVTGAMVGMAGSGIAFAARAAGSAPVRNVAARTAKVAAKAAATAALMSNPITAPLGLITAGKLAADRDAWHGVAVGAGALGRATGSALHAGKGYLEKAAGKAAGKAQEALQHRLDKTQELMDLANGTTPMPDVFGGDAGDGGTSASGQPSPGTPPTGDGAGGAAPASGDAPTEPIPATGDGQQPAAPNDDEAFNQVRAGMMDDFVNNQHMSEEEAEQAFQHEVASGNVAKAVENFGRPQQPVPVQDEPQTQAPIGTQDAANVAANTWDDVSGGQTEMPEAVNAALQRAQMRNSPVLQTPQEHLDMARRNWEISTGLPGSLMPEGAERAMNPNGIIPKSNPKADNGQTPQASA